jgi:hypothetical protein
MDMRATSAHDQLGPSKERPAIRCPARSWTFVVALVLLAATTAAAQKTDVVSVRNGDVFIGELKELDRGLLTVSTDAMGTVKVKWPRVLTVSTDKDFQIVLDDESIFFGTLRGEAPGRVIVVTKEGEFEIPTQRVVRLQRLKSGFWNSLAGAVGLSFGYTQQSAKTDLGFNGEVSHPHRTNLTRLEFDTMSSRQDGTSDIFRLNGDLAHFRQFSRRWFYLGLLSYARNSQLSLESRVGLGGGIGYVMMETDRTSLASWLGPAMTRERYTGNDRRTSVPLVLVTDYQLFLWEPLDTDIAARLQVAPVLNEGGRWRFEFTLQARKELVSDLYLAVGLAESHDTRPPLADANKNDFSLKTTLGFSFD